MKRVLAVAVPLVGVFATGLLVLSGLTPALAADQTTREVCFTPGGES